jgi:hypothetical protein
MEIEEVKEKAKEIAEKVIFTDNLYETTEGIIAELKEIREEVFREKLKLIGVDSFEEHRMENLERYLDGMIEVFTDIKIYSE